MSKTGAVERTAENNRRLLMIAFHYPPDNTSTGVLRTLKFTQYLVAHGWCSDVVSVPTRLYYSTDHDSLEGIPETTRVFRTWGGDIKKILGFRGIYPSFLGVPDRYWPWIPPAVHKAGQLIRNGEVRAVFTTYPVPSALLIGLVLKNKYGLPWVADFRDPWVEDSMVPYRRKLEGYLEHRVLAGADRVICNTPRMRRWFLDRYPDIKPDKFVTIPNGYDETDLEQIKPVKIEKFEILYSGIIAPGNRNPRPLFAGLRYAIDHGWIDMCEVQLSFLGAGAYGASKEFLHDLETFRLQDIVSVTEQRIPYRQALQRTAGADVILVLSEPLGHDKYAIAERLWSHLQVPVKVYEGLGLGCQVLALVSDGAVTDILKETRAGVTVAPEDTEGIARALQSLYLQRAGGARHSQQQNAENLQRYSRQQLAGQLAAVLDDIATMDS